MGVPRLFNVLSNSNVKIGRRVSFVDMMLPSVAKFFQRELSRMRNIRLLLCATMIRNICGFFYSVRNGKFIDKNLCSRLRVQPKLTKNFISIWTEQSHMRSVAGAIVLPCCGGVPTVLQLRNLLRIWFLHSIWFAAKCKHLIVVRHMCSVPLSRHFTVDFCIIHSCAHDFMGHGAGSI